MWIEYENLAKSNQSFVEAWKVSFAEVLAAGQFILGNQVEVFEQSWATYCEADFAVGVGSGLDALTLSLLALELPPKSEILVPAHTFIATVLSVLQAGHTPVLVEPCLATYNINPVEIEEKITDKTRAIVVVHLYGAPCDMEQIKLIAQKHHLHLIEDAAQAHGAHYKNQKVGSLGEIASFSFYPAKNLGALGDAGAIVSSSAQIVERARLLRNYGATQKYHHTEIGFNSRLDELQAAFLNTKLRHLDKINQHKQALATLYVQHLKSDFICPVILPDTTAVYHIFAIRHPRREALREYLLKHQIQTGLHYPVPLPAQKAFSGRWNVKDFPISQSIAATQLSLPIAYFHQEDDIYRVIEIMNQF